MTSSLSPLRYYTIPFSLLKIPVFIKNFKTEILKRKIDLLEIAFDLVSTFVPKSAVFYKCW